MTDTDTTVSPTMRAALLFAIHQPIGDCFYLADNERAQTVRGLESRGYATHGYLTDAGVELAREVAASRPPVLRLLDAMCARGVPRLDFYATVGQVPWPALAAFPFSRGERALLSLAEDWADGRRPPLAPVLAAVDHAYQEVLADCLDMLPVAR